MGGRRKRLISLPFLDYGGICADHPGAIESLYRAVQRELSNVRGRVIDLRQRRDMPLPLARHSDKVTMVLKLDNSPVKMWESFRAKLRNQIRKAEKEQLETQWTGGDGLKDFYHVYVCNMRDLGSPPHSFAFFERILAEFPTARLLLVRLQEHVIGGGLCLVFQDTMLMPWASSLRPYLRLCPNNLLYWEAIRTACEQGLMQFDFGRSSRGSGTYKFKKQWGALEEPLYWRSNVYGGDLLDASGQQILAFIRRGWCHLPVVVTRLVGPTLRRRISN
jgi:FemAB-related protein (PEP-CTERM system-associated)